MAIEINVEVLKEQINSGMKKDQLAAHYGLPVLQMTKVLQQAGLRIRKFKRPQFILIGGESVDPNQTSILDGGNEYPVTPEEAFRTLVPGDTSTISFQSNSSATATTAGRGEIADPMETSTTTGTDAPQSQPSSTSNSW